MTGYVSATVYPEDAIVRNQSRLDVIHPDRLNSISELFDERIKRAPDRPAYLEYDNGDWKCWSWSDFADARTRWRGAFTAEDIPAGDRVAIRLRNCIEWVLFDQGAMANGLVVVPVYADDRADNIAYIIEQTSSRLLLVETIEDWRAIEAESGVLDCLQRVVVLSGELADSAGDPRLVTLTDWLGKADAATAETTKPVNHDRNALATIVFTSGTTGKPKGVMLSHHNILSNAYSGLQSIAVFPEDRMLSFLPLSHMFERTIGCYLNVMAGSSVAFSRSIPDLLDDMAAVRPTVLITVPRIFERAYSAIKTQLDEGSPVKQWLFENAVDLGWRKFEYSQGRAQWHPGLLVQGVLDKLVGKKVRQRFGGNLRFVISGGAPLAPRISTVFIGLGIEIIQGYGLSESGPVLTVNTRSKNKPDSIGLPMTGTEIRIAENGELQARGPGVMLGYWQNQHATDEAMTEDGWLMTGDIATISDQGFISITGRIKEIVVLATGEKVPPADMESAICDDPVFEQAMVIGEGRSYLSAIIVINGESWDRMAPGLGFAKAELADFSDPQICEWAVKRVADLVQDFPGYANIYKVTLSLTPWTIESGELTPTMKIKRPVIRQRFEKEIENMYEGH